MLGYFDLALLNSNIFENKDNSEALLPTVLFYCSLKINSQKYFLKKRESNISVKGGKILVEKSLEIYYFTKLHK